MAEPVVIGGPHEAPVTAGSRAMGSVSWLQCEGYIS